MSGVYNEPLYHLAWARSIAQMECIDERNRIMWVVAYAMYMELEAFVCIFRGAQEETNIRERLLLPKLAARRTL